MHLSQTDIVTHLYCNSCIYFKITSEKISNLSEKNQYSSEKNHSSQYRIPGGVYQKWLTQSDFKFGYVPLQAQMMPMGSNQGTYTNPVDVHRKVKQTGLANFMAARIPVKSQLNIDKWKESLVGYWDQQLLQLIEYGFPLDFNRACRLRHKGVNHNSAI